MKNYHNTTGYQGEQLTIFKVKAYNQDEKMRKLFQKYKALSPSQAHNAIGVDECPLTSVRRAISNLTDDGFLIKTQIQVIGAYGRNECVWKLKTERNA